MRDFESFLKEKSACPATAVSYRRELCSFARYFSGREPEDLKRKDLIEYFEKVSREKSAASLSRSLSVIRSFYAYRLRDRSPRENPMTGITVADFEKHRQVLLDQEELDRLMSLPATGLRGRRDRLMLRIIGETGMRVSEVVDLDLDSFSKTDQTLTCGKDRHRRILSVSPGLWREWEEYRALRVLFGAEDVSAAFLGPTGKRITRQGFWKNLKDRSIRSGIGKAVSPRTLRLSVAKHLLEQGKNWEEIRFLLGNAGINFLREYFKEEKGRKNGVV